MVQLLSRYTLICKDTISNSKFIWDISSCICDFRVNIHECPETEMLTIAYWILVPYCLMLCLTSIICLYHLMYIKKESFFFNPRVNSNSRINCGFLRTRPQHTFYVTVLIYCSVQVIHSICLIYDYYPTVYWAEIGQALPRTLSISFSILYLLCIYLICIILMLLPIGTFIPLAYFTGYFADIDQITMAITFHRIQLVSWIIFCIGYLTAIISFWNNRHNLINLETNEEIKY
ncbi:4642_t:CDS:2, partial [Diversispora eburnea]